MVVCYEAISNQYGTSVVVRVLCTAQAGCPLITALAVVVDYRCSETSALKKNLNHYVIFFNENISCVICVQNGVSLNVKIKV